MKKTTMPRLQIHRETVRQLDAQPLGHVRGGEPFETVVRPSDACGTPTGGH
jgi:hypothetical protein